MSTMLFSEEEPIIAHKMALMEKTISDLLEGQNTLFSLVSEKLQPAPASVPVKAADKTKTRATPSLTTQTGSDV